MHARISATAGSMRSESAHDVHAWRQFKQASIAAATSATPSGTPLGEASNISRVSVMRLVERGADNVPVHLLSPTEVKRRLGLGQGRGSTSIRRSLRDPWAVGALSIGSSVARSATIATSGPRHNSSTRVQTRGSTGDKGRQLRNSTRVITTVACVATTESGCDDSRDGLWRRAYADGRHEHERTAPRSRRRG